MKAVIPAGWRTITEPITAVSEPRQVLAASSFPLPPTTPEPKGCGPTEVLEQMQGDGALIQVFEYTVADPSDGGARRLPDLPARPDHFDFADADFAPFECTGPSFRFVFTDGGRAFQAHVWLNRKLVDEETRAEALEILDSFDPQDGELPSQ